MLQINYALYDPAFSGLSGYWTWFPPELPQNVREVFYYEIACRHRPESPNSLKPTDLWGGMVRLDGTWTVVYRFLNGGYDLRGRPERSVIVTAWIHSTEAERIDLTALFDCPVFLSVQAAAPTACPVPQPQQLSESWDGFTVSVDPVKLARLMEARSLTLTDFSAESDLAALFANAPSDLRCHARFERLASGSRFSIEFPTKSAAILQEPEFPKPILRENPEPNVPVDHRPIRGRRIPTMFLVSVTVFFVALLSIAWPQIQDLLNKPPVSILRTTDGSIEDSGQTDTKNSGNPHQASNDEQSSNHQNTLTEQFNNLPPDQREEFIQFLIHDRRDLLEQVLEKNDLRLSSKNDSGNIKNYSNPPPSESSPSRFQKFGGGSSRK